MQPLLRTRRWSNLWLALAVPLLVVLAPAPAIAAADTTPPTAPTNLVVSFDPTYGQYQRWFDWDPATDDSGTVHYEVFVNAERIDETAATGSYDRGLYSRDPYRLTVVAVDPSWNRSAPATVQFSVLDQPGPVPTAPQNLRANLVNGVFDSFTFDPSTFTGTLWYQVQIHRSDGFKSVFLTNLHHTTLTLREMVDSHYIELGETYTFSVNAWGHSGGINRPSDYSNRLTVDFPDMPTW